MKISKASKKDKKYLEYYRKKEALRGKIQVQKEGDEFKIRIPIGLKSGMFAGLHLNRRPSVRNGPMFHHFKVRIKDVVKLIKEEQGLHPDEYISKDQIA